jgi:hypothetical protein
MYAANAQKRPDALAAHVEREHQPAQLRIFRATDFLKGSPWPGFARAAGPHGALLATIERESDEPYRLFELRSRDAALAAAANRLIFGGIPTALPDSNILKNSESHCQPRGSVACVALIDPYLHSGHVEALRLVKQHRFAVMRCGRRFGKSALILALAIDAMLLGRDVGIFTPIYALSSPLVAALASILGAVAERVSRSGLPRSITLPGGGSAELWSLENQYVGRSRRYDFVAIDEAAHVQHAEMSDMSLIFDAAIAPTLLDRKGSVLVASTPSGADEQQWFWRINNIRELGFEVFHAPTSANPFMPADEIERLRVSHHPLVFSQEFMGEFVDLSGTGLFDINKMLVDGVPIDIPDLAAHFENENAYQLPKLFDRVFMTIDCTMKGGVEGDASAFLIVAENQHYTALPRGLIVLDWFTSEAGEGDLDQDFKFVVGQYVKYARRARYGARGIFIEDVGLGSHLVRAYADFGTDVFDPGWVALGKGPKVMASLPYVNRGEIKLTRTAYEKRTSLKNTLSNHLRVQLMIFRMNDKKMKTRADDLVDVFTMAVIKGWDLEASG